MDFIYQQPKYRIGLVENGIGTTVLGGDCCDWLTLRGQVFLLTQLIQRLYLEHLRRLPSQIRSFYWSESIVKPTVAYLMNNMNTALRWWPFGSPSLLLLSVFPSSTRFDTVQEKTFKPTLVWAVPVALWVNAGVWGGRLSAVTHTAIFLFFIFFTVLTLLVLVLLEALTIPRPSWMKRWNCGNKFVKIKQKVIRRNKIITLFFYI